VEETKVLAAWSQLYVNPEEGEANGSSAASLAIAEFRGCRLVLRKELVNKPKAVVFA
jgi:hypothetical protein